MRKSVICHFLIGLCRGLDDQIPIVDNNGLSQPLIGFGTWNLDISSSNTSEAVSIAIQSGYRQIDCAAAYNNEKDVGRGIADGLKKANLKREDIWVTSKLWNDYHFTPERVEEGLNKTLKDLGLEYLDLYLMHWPVGKGPDQEKYQYDYIETWRAMTLLPSSRVRNIGVCNFSPGQLMDLMVLPVKPKYHQFELHPYLQQVEWVKWQQAHGIYLTAYSPLGNMNPTYRDRDSTSDDPPLLLKNAIIETIAEDRGCTPAQVVLAWGMSRGTSVIPKSSHEKYIKENVNATLCALERSDFAQIERVGKKFVTRFNNPSEGWGVHLFQGLDDS